MIEFLPVKLNKYITPTRLNAITFVGGCCSLSIIIIAGNIYLRAMGPQLVLYLCLMHSSKIFRTSRLSL
jgi:hypothetical protein